MICAICREEATPLNRAYSLPHVLHELRVACERVHLPVPGEGNFAHPQCVTALKTKIDKTTHRRAIDRQSWSMK